jgi:anaerobic magnesium-protoporphyrin IX monomethyl ester cyclase
VRILAVFPPGADPTRPYLALPMLDAYLAELGTAEVELYDANLDAFDSLTEETRLALARDGVERLLVERGRELDDPGRLNLEAALASAEYVIKGIAEAKATLRPRAGPPRAPEDWARALSLLKRAVELASGPYAPSGFGPGGARGRFRWDDLRELEAAVEAERENVFAEFLSRELLARVAASRPNIVKIVATFPGQVIPAFTAARLIRRSFPDVHVSLGGISMTYFGGALARWPQAKRYAHSFLLFEHEYGFEYLTHLLALGLQGERDLEAIPNLLLPGQEDFALSPEHDIPPELDRLPAPRFDQLPLDRYLCPELTLPIALSRGCAHRGCAFCLHSRAHRRRAPAEVVRHMGALEARHGAKRFFFADDSCSPEMLDALSRQLLSERRSYRWYCLARPEQGFTAELCGRLARAGCRHVLTGVESGSQRILDLMEKGTAAAAIPEVLASFHAAGIPVTAFAFAGFPGETLGEIAQTVALLDGIRDQTALIVFGRFLLQHETRIAREPNRFHIAVAAAPPGRAGFDLPFDGPEGAASGDEVAEALQRFRSRHLKSCGGRRRLLQRCIEYTGPALLLAEGAAPLGDGARRDRTLDGLAPLQLHRSVGLRELCGGSCVLFHGEADTTTLLGAGATALLRRIDGRRSASDLAGAAGARRGEALALLEQMWSAGVLQVAEASP